MNLDLARRFQNIFEPGLSFETLIERLHAKQLTDAALRRVLLHIVLHIKYYPFLEEAKNIPVPYARILGFSSKKASPLLREIRKKSSIDIIQRPIEGKKLYAASSPQAQIYNVDIRSADFYKADCSKKSRKKTGPRIYTPANSKINLCVFYGFLIIREYLTSAKDNLK